MAKSFNLDFNIYIDDLGLILKLAESFGLAMAQWDSGSEEGTVTYTFTGPKSALVKLAEFDHSLNGDGFSFSKEDVLAAVY